MHEQILKGKWNQLKGKVQKNWGKLTDNDMDKVEGELTKLQGVIQEKYGHAVDDVKKQVEDFLSKHKDLPDDDE